MKQTKSEFVFTLERAEHIKQMMDLVRATIGAHPNKNRFAASRISNDVATIDDIVYHWMYLNVDVDYLIERKFIANTQAILAEYFAGVEAARSYGMNIENTAQGNECMPNIESKPF